MPMKKKLKTPRTIGGFPLPPGPGEIKEIVEQVVGGITEAKEIPKDLMEKIVEAEEDFRSTDRALRSTRVKGRRR